MSYPTYDPIVIWNFLEHWSQKTFGTDAERGPIGPLKHLKKEADEAIANPQDINEYVDCLFLIFDATRRAGFSQQQLWDAAIEKTKELETRTYPKPTADEPSEHIREPRLDGSGTVCRHCGLTFNEGFHRSEETGSQQRQGTHHQFEPAPVEQPLREKILAQLPCKPIELLERINYPHGDSAVKGELLTMLTEPQPLIELTSKRILVHTAVTASPAEGPRTERTITLTALWHLLFPESTHNADFTSNDVAGWIDAYTEEVEQYAKRVTAAQPVPAKVEEIAERIAKVSYRRNRMEGRDLTEGDVLAILRPYFPEGKG